MFMGFLYLLAYIIDPYLFAFQFKPMKDNHKLARLDFFISFFIIFDIFLNLVTGLEKEDHTIPERPSEKINLRNSQIVN